MSTEYRKRFEAWLYQHVDVTKHAAVREAVDAALIDNPRLAGTKTWAEILAIGEKIVETQ